MSRWSADPLRIAFAPGELVLRRADNSLVLAAPERNAAALLPLLDAALADTIWRGRRVEVVLSQHFVRHVLTPPPGKALARAEEQALASASLREIYGDEANRWRIQVHSQPPRYGLIGAAVDEAFAQQLDDLLASHGLRDVAIRPLASVAARRLPKAFQGWWALVEPGWLSLFRGAHGVWQHLAGQPIDDDWAAVLPDLIERESSLLPVVSATAVWVQPVGIDAAPKPASGHADWRMLPCDAQLRGTLALTGF